MDGQVGGYAGVGISKKDLYKYIDRSRCVKIYGRDTIAAISYYLQEKADTKPITVARYNSTNDDWLGNLFWVDSLSRVDH